MPLTANVPRSTGAGCEVLVSSFAAASIQRAFQSSGLRSPISQEAGALQAEARPVPSHTRTRQVYRREDSSAGPP